MKKWAGLVLAIGIIIVAGYLFSRSKLQTNAPTPPALAKDTAYRPQPAASPIDLRPKLIAKLQELVKQGSNGLYDLSIKSVEPDVLNSSVSLANVLLVPNEAAVKHLRSKGQLPDDVFKLTVSAISIKGLGLADLVSRDVIDLKTIYISHPVIEVVHGASKEKRSAQSLYQRLMGQLKHLAIDKVVIENGTVSGSNGAKKFRFGNVDIALNQILIDSTTAGDKNRFLFAKSASLSAKNIQLPSPDPLYTLQIKGVRIAAEAKRLTATGINYLPRYSKSAFQQHIATMKERYVIRIPSAQFSGVDWWDLATGDGLQTGTITLQQPSIEVYLDRSKPAGQVKLNGFPHQLLMQVPMPVNIKSVAVRGGNLTYEEFNPLSGQAGKTFFTAINGTVQHVDNRPEGATTATATARFLGSIPIQLGLQLNRAQYKSGAFSANLKVGGFEGAAINRVSEPLGLFRIKEGTIHELSAQVSGNNQQASGAITFRYDHLHINPLEKGSDGSLNKKHLTGFFANTFVLKDENPGKNGELRQPAYAVQRGKGSFFNLLWKSTLLGILKTVGAPEKLADPK